MPLLGIIKFLEKLVAKYCSCGMEFDIFWTLSNHKKVRVKAFELPYHPNVSQEKMNVRNTLQFVDGSTNFPLVVQKNISFEVKNRLPMTGRRLGYEHLSVRLTYFNVYRQLQAATSCLILIGEV